MSPLVCRSIPGLLFTIAQASQPRVLILSKLLQLGVSKSTGFCRMASFGKQACRHLAMLIALCLLFSFVPVAGSQDAAKSAKDNPFEKFSSLFLLSWHPVSPGQVSGKDHEAGAILENGAPAHKPGSKAFSFALSYYAQSHSALRTLQAFPNPDVDDPTTMRSDQGIGDVEGEMHSGGAAMHATQTRAMLVDAKLLSAENAIRSLFSTGYRKLRSWFQDMKVFAERESDLKKYHSVVSHGLIKGNLLEVAEEEEYTDLHNNKLTRKSEIHAAAVTSHIMSPVRSPNLQGSHFGLGETREKVQIRNVVETLRKSGLFAAIAGVIEGMNLFMLPQFVTIFTPTDSAYQTVQHADIDQLQLFQYHTVVQRYAFSQVCTLTEGTILYTMRPGYSILVTKKQSPFKISLDDVFVIAPDLYVDETIAVHGIDGIFNATLYGKGLGGHVPEVATPPTVHNASSNASDTLTPLASPPGQESVLNNGSNAEAGQQGGPVQPGFNTDTDNTHTSSSHVPGSPLASETASDIDASRDTVAARYGACYAATCAFFCVLSFLCY